MLEKTEAIVLKSMKYRDTSKIVAFYTKEYGKLKGIAKGARTPKNKFGSALEPMTYSMLVIYKKEHRDLHLISQCDAIDSFRNLTEDLDRMSSALAVLELVNLVTHDEERNPVLFSLILETLNALNSSLKNYGTYLSAFRLRLAAVFGYAPDFDRCLECGKPVLIDGGERQFYFNVARGAVFCNKCLSPDSDDARFLKENMAITRLSAPGLRIIRRLYLANYATLGNLEFDSRIGNEIDELIRSYLKYHFDGLKPLKSTEIIQQHK
jgi:DNA repair protein RecO (recombination protein O)